MNNEDKALTTVDAVRQSSGSLAENPSDLSVGAALSEKDALSIWPSETTPSSWHSTYQTIGVQKCFLVLKLIMTPSSDSCKWN